MKHTFDTISFMPEQNILRLVFNTVNELIFIVERNGTIVDANLALANYFGVDIETLIGRNIYELFPKDVSEERRAQAEKVFQTKIPLRYEDVHLDHSFDALIYPIKDEIGDVKMITVFAHDITEFKNREAELRQSEEQLRLIFENSLDGILITKPDEVIISSNPTACKLLEMSEKETIAAGCKNLFDTTDPNYNKFLKRRHSEGKFFGELRAKRKDGAIFPIEVSSALFRDSKGNVNSYIIFRDITERKQVEEELLHQALHDSLTGLPNRRLFSINANMAIALAERYSHFIGVMFLDLDKMKSINDKLGHEAGDILLKEVSNRFSLITRQSDTISRFNLKPDDISGEIVARLGGDEFIFLLPRITDPKDMESFALRVIRRLQEPLIIKGKRVTMTASIGISIYPNDSIDIDTLIKQADSAMYAAKESGRNQFYFYQNIKNISQD